MSANPHANGGLLLRDLELPDFADYAVAGRQARRDATPRRRAVMGAYPARRDAASETQRNFRLFGPDETASNRLSHVFEVTDRAWDAETLALGRSSGAATAGSWRCCREHTCQGWLEGYLLTGRHGLFSCYEAFIHIVDSMFNQHAKWLKSCARDPVAAADRVAELSADLACLAAGP